ncbi:hypothetical protein MATL_G00021920 [Megalops atlanticus]|uniref:Uncharacterized protein n=1 Tax=Megalops atlanticus TaxID=7932 RepID=A0A9D3QFM7_MEGAT|nr:hypothetical protein MATL_G00021920 [Megalops atlanticus]
MPKRCVVSGCGRTPCSGVSIHQWPKKAELGKKWDQFVRQKRASWARGSPGDDKSAICSAHFHPDDFHGYRQWEFGFKTRLVLKPGAVPSVSAKEWRNSAGSAVVRSRRGRYSKAAEKALVRRSAPGTLTAIPRCRKRCVKSVTGEPQSESPPGIKACGTENRNQRDGPVGEGQQKKTKALEEEKREEEGGERGVNFAETSLQLSVNIPNVNGGVLSKDTGLESQLQHTGGGSLNVQYQRCPAEVLFGNRDLGSALEDSGRPPVSTDHALRQAASSDTGNKVSPPPNRPSKPDRLGPPSVSREELQQIKTRKAPYYCTQCGKSFLNRGVLLEHAISHSLFHVSVIDEDPDGEEPVKPHSCSQCGKKFHTRNGLSIHLHSHLGKKLFCCRRCGINFSSHEQFLQHTRAVHPLKRPYSCTLCRKTFMKASTCRKHQDKHQVTPYRCCHCSLYFKSKASLGRHRLCLKKERFYVNARNQSSSGERPSGDGQLEQQAVAGKRPPMNSPELTCSPTCDPSSGETARKGNGESTSETGKASCNTETVELLPIKEESPGHDPKPGLNRWFEVGLNWLSEMAQEDTGRATQRSSPVEEDGQPRVCELGVKKEGESERNSHFNTVKIVQELRVNLWRLDHATIKTYLTAGRLNCSSQGKGGLDLPQGSSGEPVSRDGLPEQQAGAPAADPQLTHHTPDPAGDERPSSGRDGEGKQDDPSGRDVSVTPPTSPAGGGGGGAEEQALPSAEKSKKGKEGQVIADNEDGPWRPATRMTVNSPGEAVSPEWEVVELWPGGVQWEVGEAPPEPPDRPEGRSGLHVFLEQLEEELGRVSVASVQEQLRRNILSLVHEAQRQCGWLSTG